MLSKALITDVLTAAVTTGGDFAELFIEERDNGHMTLVGGKIEQSLSGKDFGVGIRIFNDLASVYAYTNNASRENLMKVAREAALAINNSHVCQVLDLREDKVITSHPIRLMPDAVPKLRKVEFMRQGYDAMINYDAMITQGKVTYLEGTQHVLIANTEGVCIEDTRVRSRIVFQAIATKGTEMQTGVHSPGAHVGCELLEDMDIDYIARDSARMAKTMVEAGYAPSGKMPVIIGNHFGGVLFHEACGHGLEATSVAKKTSVFTDKIGEQVASPLVTAIDDGTIPNAWGSMNIDDEGASMQKNVLIEKGILKGYMIDKLNARRMNMSPTGSGRRQSYRFAPTSRMTNTYIAKGHSTTEAIIADTAYGLYAKHLGGGSVNTATGDFNFAVREGYMIKNGKIIKPVRGATIIGNGPEILKKIDRVGKDLDHGQGVCGSISGSIPTNVGQPTIRVSDITVGGRDGK